MNQLRPLSIGEILDVAFKLYFRHWKKFVGIVALFVIPANIINGLILSSSVKFAYKGHLYYVDNSSYNSSLLVIGIVGFIALLLITACSFRAVSEAYMGHEPSPGESIRFAVPRLLSLMWIFILAGLGLAIGFVLLVIPGIYLSVIWCVIVPVLMVEGAKGPAALGRSRDLVRGRWWQTFGVLLVLGVLVAALPRLIVQPIAAALLSGSSSVGTIVVVAQVIDALLRIVTVPAAIAGVVVLYFDLRVRREGFDMSLMIDALGFAPPAAPPGVGPTGLPLVPAPTTSVAPPSVAPPGFASPPVAPPAPPAAPPGFAPPVAPDVGLPEDPRPPSG